MCVCVCVRGVCHHRLFSSGDNCNGNWNFNVLFILEIVYAYLPLRGPKSLVPRQRHIQQRGERKKKHVVVVFSFFYFFFYGFFCMLLVVPGLWILSLRVHKPCAQTGTEIKVIRFLWFSVNATTDVLKYIVFNVCLRRSVFSIQI